ncbi:MAG: TlpA family protein disulfide reductase [Xanthomonadales bacterium]|nr:TlpA family protein disulfide reductase [Xanthomonadales bacterium]
MLRSLFLLLVGCATGVTAAATDIRPIQSWADYRLALTEDGSSDEEADAEIAAALGSLNRMDRAAGDDLIGSAALPFRFDAWLDGPALTLESLRGRVVLVRWWTDTCPFCASSAPALRTLQAEYADRGLQVIGVFHPKAGRDDPLDVDRVRRAVQARQFTFPIAIDWHWRTGTLHDWWLSGPERPATSVTFILDKQGVIRFIHPGMEYHDPNGAAQHAVCANDMGRIRAVIERLAAE